MTPKEELIQVIETSPENVISMLLGAVRRLQDKPERAMPLTVSSSARQNPTEVSERLAKKNGFLVVATGGLNEFDTTVFMSEMREERIQSQIDKIGL